VSKEWVVHWSPRSERCIRKLGKGPVTDRIRQEVNSLTTRPRRGKYLPSLDIYSLRIGTTGGEYRAIYQLISEDHAVLITLVASREHVYEILSRLDSV